MSTPYICLHCRGSGSTSPVSALISNAFRPARSSTRRHFSRPTFAPKPALNIKHIRENPGLYQQNCRDRKYEAYAENSWSIVKLHESQQQQRLDADALRKESNALNKELGKRATQGQEVDAGILERAKKLKAELALVVEREKNWQRSIEELALELPNLSSARTPVGSVPEVIDTINADLLPSGRLLSRSHVDIGKDLGILDFEGSATTSGWGWYFLQNEGALLEQALIQYALAVAMRHGWQVRTPPSLVYQHVASACGFMPRDQHGETQIYHIELSPEDARKAQNREKDAQDIPRMVLTGTAEIPFAGSQADRIFAEDQLPLKVVGPSRCYRAEAGARGVDTKGLYRVHEFTKVEMFAWTLPQPLQEGDRFDDSVSEASPADAVFDEMLAIQREIISGLGLHAKVLEMPSEDLGASASRKVDIEAFFPSRTTINDGYGEVTSASNCTDHQTRRLATRVKVQGKNVFPYTVNGTALAVPRVLACLLENHYDPATGTVRIPAVLQPYMPGQMDKIQVKS